MAATKYQVLYRYVNEATNTPITNTTEEDYEPVREFYTYPDHKIFSPDDNEKEEAMNEQQEMIYFSNSSDNPKNNMLFAYDGTKKIKHKQWVPEGDGYIVRDLSKIKRSDIGDQGDFTKDFTTINAATVEDGGTVVCNATVMKKYFPKTITVVSDNTQADAGTQAKPYYTKEKIEELIVQSTFFVLKETDYTNYTTASRTGTLKTGYYSSDKTTYYYGPVAIEGNPITTLYGYGSAKATGSWDSTYLYGSVVVNNAQLETTTIPGHYEEALDSPYLIMDTYKRIQLSPWFVNCTCGSLESALTKARLLVDMLGIENVKLIKVVPFDQFVKIK